MSSPGDRQETIELSKLREIIREEYNRWVNIDSDRDLMLGISLGGIGACSNILCRAEGFTFMERPADTDPSPQHGKEVPPVEGM
jgi:hypothetical protein